MGDQGTGPVSSNSALSSLSTWVPDSCMSRTCCRVGSLTFSSSWRGARARSITHRRGEKGSRTCASGMSMPTICVSRGTSRRGNTSPGLSQRQVRSSRFSVCRVFVCPGVALTLTTLSPTMLLMSEDLPTLGCPTIPSMTRPPVVVSPPSCADASPVAAPAAAPVATSAAAPAASPAGSSACVGLDLSAAPAACAAAWARWQASISADLPTSSGLKSSGLKDSLEKPTMPEIPGIPLCRHAAHCLASDGSTVSSLLRTITRGFCSVRVAW
mmetsp:Transcript_68600/g.155463  ORF Transcript_68600/g.155463 Transcript_68600/m.155463 type:complete len:270 (-) Transcript_68600:216-1025(-)